MPTQNSHIVIVDDDAGILEAVKIILEGEGYKVTASSDGEYIETLAKNPKKPDLILLDVLLSGKDGRELCAMLKKNEVTRHIPIIMFSAHPSASTTVKKAGADAFLAKPFNIGDL